MFCQWNTRPSLVHFPALRVAPVPLVTTSGSGATPNARNRIKLDLIECWFRVSESVQMPYCSKMRSKTRYVASCSKGLKIQFLDKMPIFYGFISMNYLATWISFHKLTRQNPLIYNQA